MALDVDGGRWLATGGQGTPPPGPQASPDVPDGPAADPSGSGAAASDCWRPGGGPAPEDWGRTAAPDPAFRRWKLVKAASLKPDAEDRAKLACAATAALMAHAGASAKFVLGWIDGARNGDADALRRLAVTLRKLGVFPADASADAIGGTLAEGDVNRSLLLRDMDHYVAARGFVQACPPGLDLPAADLMGDAAVSYAAIKRFIQAHPEVVTRVPVLGAALETGFANPNTSPGDAEEVVVARTGIRDALKAHSPLLATLHDLLDD